MSVSYIPYEFETGTYRAKVRAQYKDANNSTSTKDSNNYLFVATKTPIDQYYITSSYISIYKDFYPGSNSITNYCRSETLIKEIEAAEVIDSRAFFVSGAGTGFAGYILTLSNCTYKLTSLYTLSHSNPSKNNSGETITSATIATTTINTTQYFTSNYTESYALFTTQIMSYNYLSNYKNRYKATLNSVNMKCDTWGRDMDNYSITIGQTINFKEKYNTQFNDLIINRHDKRSSFNNNNIETQINNYTTKYYGTINSTSTFSSTFSGGGYTWIYYTIGAPYIRYSTYEGYTYNNTSYLRESYYLDSRATHTAFRLDDTIYSYIDNNSIINSYTATNSTLIIDLCTTMPLVQF